MITIIAILITLVLSDVILFPRKWIFFFWSLQYKGNTIYPIYRIWQGALDIISIWYIYTNYGLYPTIGFLLAWYFMAKEYLFYVFRWAWQEMLDFENKHIDTYWLERIWFSGWWLFRPEYLFVKFTFSFLIGLILLIISCLV